MHERLRVLHLTPHFPPTLSGIADYAGSLAAELAALGAEVRVLTGAESAGMHVPGVTVAATVKRWDNTLGPAVAADVAAFRPDVLHIHYQQGMYGGDPTVGSLPWTLGVKGLRPAIVTTLHDMTPPARGSRLRARAAFEALLLGSSRIIVSGEAEARGLARRPGLKARTIVLPIGSNIAVHPVTRAARRRLRDGLSAGEREFLLVYFGLIRAGKGIEVLLDALAAVRKSHVGAELVVVGDVGQVDGQSGAEYRTALLAQTAALGLDDHVQFLGRLSEDRVSEVLQASDAAVFPFLGGVSAGHTSVFAAMGHGLPVITTRGLGTPSMLTDGAVALVPAPPEIQALAGAIEHVATDSHWRESLAAAGRALADRYSRPAIAAEVASIYSAVAHRTLVVSPAKR